MSVILDDKPEAKVFTDTQEEKKVIKCDTHRCSNEAHVRHQIYYAAPIDTWGKKYYMCSNCVNSWKIKKSNLVENVDYVIYTKQTHSFWNDRPLYL
jgi:hypothetical protein